jgi:protein-S-isoprenylcysteine O-methyltransferase Ste14
MRWGNVPLPEPHLIGLGLGFLGHVVAPRRLPAPARIGQVVGGTTVVAGTSYVVWAVRAAGNVDLGRQEQLVTDGPYRLSRNPMYVGWTVVYIGIGLVVDNAWLFVLLPGVLLATHVAILHEEQRLADRFGSAYRAYRASVRRYVGTRTSRRNFRREAETKG